MTRHWPFHPSLGPSYSSQSSKVYFHLEKKWIETLIFFSIESGWFNLHEELFCLTAKQRFSCFIYACTQKRPNISFLCSCRVLLQHKQIKYEIVRNTIPDSLSLSLSHACPPARALSLHHSFILTNSVAYYQYPMVQFFGITENFPWMWYTSHVELQEDK